MRPVVRGARPLKPNGQPKVYSAYDQARSDLIDRMGEYCAYCNQRLPASLAVEHIQPKVNVPELELEWDNFLLACTNCNSTKGDKPVELDAFVWPHLHNTHLAFRYTPDGKVHVNEALSENIKVNAQAMLDLVGLQRYESTPTASDRRWKNRKEAFQKAQVVQRLYLAAKAKGNGTEFAEMIGLLAAQNGFFSVWMSVFEAHPEVKRQLLTHFVGTATDAFDSECNPVFRTAFL